MSDHVENFATVGSETKVEINCIHKLYGAGKITNLRFAENQGKPEIFLSFESETKSVALAYGIVTRMNLLQFDETDSETLSGIYDEYVTNWTTYDNERKAEQIAKREAEAAQREEAKKAKADEKKLEALEKKKEHDIQSFEDLTKLTRPVSAASEFYTTLGWLAKHIGTVTARLPDYLEPSFTKYFGDVPRYVFDSKKKSPSGWTYQWALALSASIKKATTVPATLEAYLNPTRKALTDTEFVWDLVDSYGFKFGKTQDLEAIRSCVPSTYQTDFETGLAM